MDKVRVARSIAEQLESLDIYPVMKQEQLYKTVHFVECPTNWLWKELMLFMFALHF